MLFQEALVRMLDFNALKEVITLNSDPGKLVKALEK